MPCILHNITSLDRVIIIIIVVIIIITNHVNYACEGELNVVFVCYIYTV